MSSEPICLEKHGEIAHLVSNRPEKRNALNRKIEETIPQLTQAIEADRDIQFEEMHALYSLDRPIMAMISGERRQYMRFLLRWPRQGHQKEKPR